MTGLWKSSKLAFFLHLCKALAAVDRTVFAGLERNASFFAACCAGSGVHLAGATAGVLAGITAGFAALGLVLEATACIEFLLTGGKYKFFAAIFAYQSLVFVHFGYLHFGLNFARGRIHTDTFDLGPTLFT